MSKGGSIKFWEYYGTIAGVLGVGRAKTLHRISQDGKDVWFGPLHNPGTGAYSTVTIDAKRRLRLYWGEENQAACTLLPGHPPYPGVCYVVLDDYFFGRERTSAPLLEFDISFDPEQSIVTGNLTLDQESSAVAAIAEILTDTRHGLGLPASLLDGTSWEAVQDKHEAKDEEEYLSPFVGRQGTARSTLMNLASVPELWARLNAGQIELGKWPDRADDLDVSSLPTWTADDLTDRPEVRAYGWKDVETGWSVTFSDRDRAYKESSEKWDDARAFRVVGEPRRNNLERPFITRRKQARTHGQRTGRRLALPGMEAKVSVRRGKGLSVLPGDLVQLDIEPEPGGLQWLQVFRVLERDVPWRGPIQFRLEAERSLSPTPRTPEADLPPSVTNPTVGDITNARLFELPPILAGGNSSRIAPLLERPDELMTGASAWYDSAAGGDYYRIGNIEDFALRAKLTGAESSSDTTLRMDLLSAYDKHLLDDDPGAVAAADNDLLAILIKDNGSGQIAEDAAGAPYMEICSISAIGLVAADQYDLTVLRGRLGTANRAFAQDDEVWIIRREALVPLRHADFVAAAGGGTNLYFRFTGYSAYDEFDLASATTHTFAFSSATQYAPRITINSPSSGTNYSTPPGGVSMSVTVEDPDGNLASISAIARLGAGDDQTVFSKSYGGVSAETVTIPLNINASGTWTVTITAVDSNGVSTELSATYTVDAASGTVNTPVLDPAGALIEGGGDELVEISCSTTGATIWTAVKALSDGSAPAWPADYTEQGAAPYTMNVFGGTKLYARATKSGMTDSSAAVGNYYLYQDPGTEPR